MTENQPRDCKLNVQCFPMILLTFHSLIIYKNLCWRINFLVGSITLKIIKIENRISPCFIFLHLFNLPNNHVSCPMAIKITSYCSHLQGRVVIVATVFCWWEPGGVRYKHQCSLQQSGYMLQWCLQWYRVCGKCTRRTTKDVRLHSRCKLSRGKFVLFYLWHQYAGIVLQIGTIVTCTMQIYIITVYEGAIGLSHILLYLAINLHLKAVN